jgi:hypothetical protein
VVDTIIGESVDFVTNDLPDNDILLVVPMSPSGDRDNPITLD